MTSGTVSVFPRFDSGYIFGVSLRVLLKEFHFFYVKDISEVDSRPGAVRTGNLDIISTSSSYDVVDGFLPLFAAFFALRPHGRRVPGGGDAGSSLPGVLPPN